MANANVGQSAVEVVFNDSPRARVFQEFVEIVLIPGPVVPAMQSIVGGGCAGDACNPEPVRSSGEVRIPKRRPSMRGLMQAIYFRHGR